MNPTDQTPADDTQRICTQPASDGRIQAENAVGSTTEPPPDDADAMLDRIRIQRRLKEDSSAWIARGFWIAFIAFGSIGPILSLVPPYRGGDLLLRLTSGLMTGLVFGSVMGCLVGFIVWFIQLSIKK